MVVSGWVSGYTVVMTNLFEDLQNRGLFYASGNDLLGEEETSYRRLVPWELVRSGYFASPDETGSWVSALNDSRKSYGFTVGFLQNPAVVADDVLAEWVAENGFELFLVAAVTSGCPVTEPVFRKAVKVLTERVVAQLKYIETVVRVTEGRKEEWPLGRLERGEGAVLARLAKSSWVTPALTEVLMVIPFKGVREALLGNPVVVDDFKVMLSLL